LTEQAFDERRDTDGDGVIDGLDACPAQPEDMDGFADLDGCPEDDNDEDGLVDAEDRCPTEPETVNSYLDEDGCPDDLRELYCDDCNFAREGPVVPVVLLFAPDDEIPRATAYESLDDVAQRVARDSRARIEIVGHVAVETEETDAMLLSMKRAEVIQRLLVDRGVPKERITLRAEGAARPRVSAASEGASVLNDRVEIFVR
jgi:outer membrane protein OmpA-like peptidoglycan-associated protein